MIVRPQIDLVLVDLVRDERSGLFKTLEITTAEYLIDDHQLVPGHRRLFGIIIRVDIDQFGMDIGVRSVRGDPEMQFERTRQFEILGQRRGREGQHIRPIAQRAVRRASAEQPWRGALVIGAGAHHRLAG